jgi:hypothetical protein
MDSLNQRIAMDGVLETAEYKRMMRQPRWLLMLRLRLGMLGKYRQIWKAVAAKATPEDANELLIDYIESAPDFLDRYWCANALIALNRLDRFGWRAGNLSAQYCYREELAKIRPYLAREAAGITPNDPPSP